MASETTTTTDHDEIRGWVESHGGRPARIRGTADPDGTGGVARIDFPGGADADDLEPIEWDDWFRIFDARGLALRYQLRKADGSDSTFNTFVERS